MSTATSQTEQAYREWEHGNYPGYYPRREAARLCRCSWQRLRGWERRGIVTPHATAVASWAGVGIAKQPGYTRADLDVICEHLGYRLIPDDLAPYIEINPQIQFGQPVIKGTRLPTWCCLTGWAVDDDEFERSYPDIPIAAARAARAWEALIAVAATPQEAT